ncbi:MAG: polyprenyl synthetase family protein [Desulfurococcales archaeon]|nr:polyprenyl synthetase family protein [Desulfurococcales archaeon]
MKYSVAKQQYLEEKAKIAIEWQKAKKLIDERLEEILSTLGEDALPSVAKHIITGGKRFRGFLTIATAKALGAKVEDALDAAVAIELVQAASLAIDDIIDRDSERRGKRAAWVLFGVEKTVLTSLILIPVAQRIVEKLGFKALFHVIRTWEVTVRGEVMDSILGRRLPPTSYMRLVEEKTAALFKLSTILGALSAGVSDDNLLDNVGRYGLKVGIIYQVADDLADYTVKTRKDVPLQPGEELFIKWAKSLNRENPIDASIEFLREQVWQAASIVDNIPFKEEYKAMFRLIPVFLVKKLFEEAGVDYTRVFDLV